MVKQTVSFHPVRAARTGTPGLRWPVSTQVEWVGPPQTNSLLYVSSISRYALQNIMQFQTPPALGNQYDDDYVLCSYLKRTLPADILREIEPALSVMGELAGGELYQMQLADRLNEPKLTQWDAWGNRIDRIELTPLWRVAERIAAEHGVVATAYE